MITVNVLKNLKEDRQPWILPDYGLYIPCDANGSALEDQLALHKMLKGVKPGSICYMAAMNKHGLELKVAKVVIPS